MTDTPQPPDPPKRKPRKKRTDQPTFRVVTAEEVQRARNGTRTGRKGSTAKQGTSAAPGASGGSTEPFRGEVVPGNPWAVRASWPEGGDWIPMFLLTLSNTGVVRAACMQAGIDRKTAYNWYAKEPLFALLWEEAMEDAVDILEAVLINRAKTGDITALIFALKGLRPKKYADKAQQRFVAEEEMEARIQAYAAKTGLPAETIRARLIELKTG